MTRQPRRADVPWDEPCPHCLQPHRHEDAYHCVHCDHPVCPFCVVLRRDEPICPSCIAAPTEGG